MVSDSLMEFIINMNFTIIFFLKKASKKCPFVYGSMRKIK